LEKGEAKAMSEVILPRPHREFAGYKHSFDRYFQYEGQRVDRLKLIREHGIVSPRKAKELEIPYVVECHIRVWDVDNYDDVIFLSPIRGQVIVRPNWGLVAVLSSELPILTPADMKKIHGGNWPVLAPGEVYTYAQIRPEFITGIQGVIHE
jgi:hypothetical protein